MFKSFFPLRKKVLGINLSSTVLDVKKKFMFNLSKCYVRKDFKKNETNKYAKNKNYSNEKKSKEYVGNKYKSNKEPFTYKIQEFNEQASKYSLNNEEFKQNIPKYLENYNKNNFTDDFNDEINSKNTDLEVDSNFKGNKIMNPDKLRAGKRMAIIKKPFQKKMSKEEKLARSKALLIESKANKNKLIPKAERKMIENNETSIERHNEKYMTYEKENSKNVLIRLRNEKYIERKRIFNTENLTDFEKEERLSKRMARMGIVSRRHAEKLIKQGMIKVDGIAASANFLVNDKSNIKIYTTNGYKTPVPESVRIWLFYKPAGIICTKADKTIPSIFQYLDAKKFQFKNYHVIGKLDINSEGLIVLTNNSDIAEALEHNDQIERQYKVRVYGRMFTEEKLEKIRRGMTINLKKIKLWAELIHKQNSNTWVHIKATNNSIIDIRNVFRKLSLRVNRIIRTNYGPYNTSELKNPGDITETNVHKAVSKYLYSRYKEKLQISTRKLDDTKLESIKLNLLNEQKKKNYSLQAEKQSRIERSDLI